MTHSIPPSVCLAAASLFALPVLTAQGHLLRVDPSDPGAFAEIQDAVDAAAAGARILVFPGTYAPFVVQTDRVRIVGLGRPGSVVVDGAGSNATEGVVLDADGVRIRGLTVQNVAVGVPNRELGDGIAIFGGDGIVVRNCVALGNNSYGIAVAGGSGHVVAGCRVERNGIGVGFTSPGAGRPETFSTDSVIRSCIAEDNAFHGVVNFGSGSVRNALEGNFARGNGVMGLFVGEGSTDLNVRRNVATGNGVDGIYVQFASDFVIGNNAAFDNGRHGFAIRETFDSTFRLNLSRDNAGNGFSIDDFSALGGPGPSLRNVFVLNAGLDNAGFGFFVDPSSTDNQWALNRFAGNTLGESNIPLD